MFSSLSKLQQWLIEDFEVANPWSHPGWFMEDFTILFRWFQEDYLFSSRVFWVSCYLLFAWALLLIVIDINRSYHRYLALGPGYLPPNFGGWLTTKFLEFLIQYIFHVDVFSKPWLEPSARPYSGVLDLPMRTTPPPKIIGLDPYSQETGRNQVVVRDNMQGFMAVTRDQPGRLELGFYRGVLPTLRRVQQPPQAERLRGRWRRLPLVLQVPALFLFEYRARLGLSRPREWRRQLAVAHYDGSVSLNVHPNDAYEIIQKGWGQRNPLSVLDEIWVWRFFFHWILWKPTPVPYFNVIVYAPANEDEMEVARGRCLEAAVLYANRM